MKKIVLFVLGPDRPGIIASISKVLFELNCNLEDVSQTILQGEFISIVIASIKASEDDQAVLTALRIQLEPFGLFVHIKKMRGSEPLIDHPGESFVITTVGPDRPGLIAGISEVLAHYSINITNLKAVSRVDQQPPHYITIYEVDIPPAIDFHIFRTDLYKRAQELDLDINLQHREIFEKINQV
jgi:glycine cleavage system transcriptional repressor